MTFTYKLGNKPDLFQLLRATLTKSKQRTVYTYSRSISWSEILTREVNGKSRLGDVKVSLKLNGDNVESGVDPLWQQRTADLLQRHFILRRPVPHLQDVMGCLCVKGKKLQTGRDEHRILLL